MFRFEDISYLYLMPLVLVVLAVMYVAYMWSQRRLGAIGDIEFVKRLMPDRSTTRVWIKNGLLLGGLILLLAAAANPQWGTKKEKIKSESADIFIAFDISQSMMAEDVSPSRLERSKRFAGSLVEELKGDRIGLILFAGDAYLQMPLTTDYAAAKIAIKSANPNLAGTQGTSIGNAIQEALDAYEEGVSHQRALVIITDGEDHEPAAQELAEQAADAGLVIYTVGVGTEEGSYVPYITERGAAQFKKDKEGVPVLSKLNVESLQELARVSNGEFYLVNQGDAAITDLSDRLDRIQKREVEQRSFSEYNSYFQWFLGLAFMLLLLEWILPNGLKKTF